MKKDRKKNRKKKPDSYMYNEDFFIVKQKQKARELRKSSWWRKKISTGICYYCGENFLPSDLTMDHKIPLTRGGLSEKDNLVPACKECNNKKKYMLPTEWDEYMDRIKNSL